MKKIEGIIFDIEHGSFVDGPGIRTTVFLKGCNLRCAWCHNPESQSRERERMFFKDKCVDCGLCKRVCPSPEQCILCGRCESVCPQGAIKLIGKRVSVKQVMEEIIKDREFYECGGGVTFSGGECMLQIDFLEALLRCCKAEGIHTAVDTAGCVPWEYFQRILPYTDLFLYDIKLADRKKHQIYTGADNSLIVDNLYKLGQEKKNIHVRIPVIGGVNDNAEEMEEIAGRLKNTSVDKIELLPYHAMGENKFPALGRAATKFTVPEAKRIAEYKNQVSFVLYSEGLQPHNRLNSQEK